MSIIKIKRSSGTAAPSALALGELAYAYGAGTQANGGARLYLGTSGESGGVATAIDVVGGKYFVDLLDHAHGTLTASSAIIVDANSKIDALNVDNITINGNTISSTDTNGNIVLDPAGTGYVTITGTNALVIPVGTTAQRAPLTTGAIRYNTDTSQFEGYGTTNWTPLGGVRSVDGYTYITAEATAGASDDIIHFYGGNVAGNGSVETARLDIVSLRLLQNTSATNTTSGSLVVTGGAGISENLYVGGNEVITGDLAVNGGDLTTNQTTFNLLGTNATTVNIAAAGTTVNIGAATGTTNVNNNLTVVGNLVVNGTTTTVNSNTVTLDDVILTLGGDTAVAETSKDRGVEFKWAGATVAITNYIGAGTTTVTATVASTAGYAVGDIITISGATTTEQSKLNGTWALASVPNATTFTFVVTSALAAATYTTNIGTCVKSKNGFFGLDQSTGYFTFIPQSSNASEVYAGTLGDMQATNFRGALVGNADTASKWATARTITLAGDLTGNVTLDGSANVTLTVAVAANSVALGTDTTGDYVASVAAGATPNGIVVAGTGEGATVTVSANLATTSGTIGTSTYDATNFDVSVAGLVTIDTVDGGTF